jgi:hypothetical protein
MENLLDNEFPIGDEGSDFKTTTTTISAGELQV